MENRSFQVFEYAGLALDPIHVGTGGSRLGRVDNTIVRDPVTRVPKIPGSSLAGVLRAYAAMVHGKYPACAGQGDQRDRDGAGGHCRQADCPICTVFGFARNDGGFAGLAGFSDAQVLLFPVATREGPVWITCPMALRLFDGEYPGVTGDAVLRERNGNRRLNLGWLLLRVETFAGDQKPSRILECRDLPEYVRKTVGVVSDQLFSHIVNSNLEVRTSVSIKPETGAAEKGALFTYEALPRGTVLYWDITCKHPKHFKVGSEPINFKQDNQSLTPHDVKGVVSDANVYLKHLGIGGMGTRGMGRLEIFEVGRNGSGKSAEKNPQEAS